MRAPVLPTIVPPPRRRSFGGLTASVLLHALLLLLIISPWFRRYHLLSAEGSDLPGTGGGGGRSGEQYIALPALRPAATPPPAVHVETPAVPPPVVIPTVIPPPTPAPDTIVPPQPQTSATDATGGATGGAAGTGGGGGGGNGAGQGPGTGGGAGPGTGGARRGTPPERRQFVVPPMTGTPKELRGATLLVRFYVSAAGVVDRIETDPPLPSGKYANDFNELMQGFKFRPARDSLGVAVPGIAEVTITLSTH